MHKFFSPYRILYFGSLDECLLVAVAAAAAAAVCLFVCMLLFFLLLSLSFLDFSLGSAYL